MFASHLNIAIIFLICLVTVLGISRESVSSPNLSLNSLSEQPAENQLSVLFIGNSHTFVNGVPGLLAEIAAANGQQIWYRSAVEGGKSLEWHSSNKQTQDLLRQRHWDFVILQPRSTEPIDSPEEFRSGLKKLENSAVASEATSILYCTWGRELYDPYRLHAQFSWAGKDFVEMTQRLHSSCVRNKTYSRVAAVGNEWIRFRSRYPSIALHSSDGNHARQVGSYIAAMTIYKVINSTATGNNCTRPAGIDQKEFEALVAYSKTL